MQELPALVSGGNLEGRLHVTSDVPPLRSLQQSSCEPIPKSRQGKEDGLQLPNGGRAEYKCGTCDRSVHCLWWEGCPSPLIVCSREPGGSSPNNVVAYERISRTPGRKRVWRVYASLELAVPDNRMRKNLNTKLSAYIAQNLPKLSLELQIIPCSS